jgi:hypothetical protein
MQNVLKTVAIAAVAVSLSPVLTSATVFADVTPGVQCIATTTTLPGNQKFTKDVTIKTGTTLIIGNDLRIEKGIKVTVEAGASLVVKGQLFAVDNDVINNYGTINARTIELETQSVINNYSLVEAWFISVHEPGIALDGQLNNLLGGITRPRKSNPTIDFVRHSIIVNGDAANLPDFKFEEFGTGKVTQMMDDSGRIKLLNNPELFGKKGWLYQIDGLGRSQNAEGVKEWIEIPARNDKRFADTDALGAIKVNNNTITGLKGGNYSYELTAYKAITDSLHDSDPLFSLDLPTNAKTFKVPTAGFYELTASYTDDYGTVLFPDAFTFTVK